MHSRLPHSPESGEWGECLPSAGVVGDVGSNLLLTRSNLLRTLRCGACAGGDRLRVCVRERRASWGAGRGVCGQGLRIPRIPHNLGLGCGCLQAAGAAAPTLARGVGPVSGLLHRVIDEIR